IQHDGRRLPRRRGGRGHPGRRSELLAQDIDGDRAERAQLGVRRRGERDDRIRAERVPHPRLHRSGRWIRDHRDDRCSGALRTAERGEADHEKERHRISRRRRQSLRHRVHGGGGEWGVDALPGVRGRGSFAVMTLVRSLTTLSLVFILYFSTSGGAFTTETLVSSVGPGMTLLILAVVPIVY